MMYWLGFLAVILAVAGAVLYRYKSRNNMKASIRESLLDAIGLGDSE